MMPIIYPPQVAIVGFGSILERPWVVDGAVRAAPVITITLAADHRVSDGRAGARLLRHIHDALQAPETPMTALDVEQRVLQLFLDFAPDVDPAGLDRVTAPSREHL
jgi:2-oxoacid dehydrogenases acyltransferase (catalytic domain)